VPALSTLTFSPDAVVFASAGAAATSAGAGMALGCAAGGGSAGGSALLGGSGAGVLAAAAAELCFWSLGPASGGVLLQPSNEAQAMASEEHRAKGCGRMLAAASSIKKIPCATPIALEKALVLGTLAHRPMGDWSSVAAKCSSRDGQRYAALGARPGCSFCSAGYPLANALGSPRSQPASAQNEPSTRCVAAATVPMAREESRRKVSTRRATSVTGPSKRAARTTS